MSLLCRRIYGEENERYEFEINDKESCFLLLCAYVTGRQHMPNTEREKIAKKQKIIEQYLTAIVVCFELFC